MLKLTGTNEVSNIVNVSKCDAYKDEYCKYQTSIMFTEHNLCSNFPNCYYRQLKKCEEKLEKIEESVTARMTGIACRHILSIIEGEEDEY